MKILALITSILGVALAGCAPEIPKDQVVHLKLGDEGKHPVSVSIKDDTPSTTETERYRFVIKNWTSLWQSAENSFQKIISDYKYPTSLKDIIRNPRNMIVLSISDDSVFKDTNWSIFIRIEMPHGHHEFICEFQDSTVTAFQPCF